MKSQYDGKCKKCGRTWSPGDEYYGKKVNGEWKVCCDRSCADSQISQTPANSTGTDTIPKPGQFTSAKFPLHDALKVFEVAQILTDQYLQRYDPDGNMTNETKAQIFESFFKSLSMGFKPDV
jgi:hypothetical protein